VAKCPRCDGSGRAPWLFNKAVVDYVRCGLCDATGVVDAPRNGRGHKAAKPESEPSDFFPGDPNEE
jgi:hypothetical protein